MMRRRTYVSSDEKALSAVDEASTPHSLLTMIHVRWEGLPLPKQAYLFYMYFLHCCYWLNCCWPFLWVNMMSPPEAENAVYFLFLILRNFFKSFLLMKLGEMASSRSRMNTPRLPQLINGLSEKNPALSIWRPWIDSCCSFYFYNQPQSEWEFRGLLMPSSGWKHCKSFKSNQRNSGIKDKTN